MKRGYPRPQMRVEKTVSDVDRERWDNRSYPLPYSARTDLISRINYGRIKECINFRKCIVCGEVVDIDSDGKVTILYDRGRIGTESGPFHEKCARLTANLCPVIAQDVERKAADAAEYTRFGFGRFDWLIAQSEMKRDYNSLYKNKKDVPNT